MTSSIHNILITGGCGFIASHVAIHLVQTYPNYNIVVLDKLDYCSSMKNIQSIINQSNFTFIKGDICSSDMISYILSHHKIDTIMHFAAQTHVDNSFGNSLYFTKNNILGTHTLLEATRQHIASNRFYRFIHVSTDEIYGEGNTEILQKENTIMEPTNPYAATKASAELIAKAYMRSFQVPLIITRGNNVYGPHQYPEKIIPKFINLLLRNKPLSIHGTGENRRNYLFVKDCVSAFDIILHKGANGNIYNIGSSNEYSNLQIAESITKHFGRNDSILYVRDRHINDKRYPIDSSKLKNLGWKEKISWNDGLQQTIEWYIKNQNHWENIDVCLKPHPTRY